MTFYRVISLLLVASCCGTEIPAMAVRYIGNRPWFPDHTAAMFPPLELASAGCRKWFFGVSPRTCAHRCLQRSESCGYAGYHRHLQICYLCSWDIPFWWQVAVSMTTDITTWSQKALAGCHGNSCQDPKICWMSNSTLNNSSTASSRNTDTEELECDVPPPAILAVTSWPPSLRVGTVIRYTCTGNSVPAPNTTTPYVVCQSDLTWSSSDFQCIRPDDAV